jgi:putative acetyltransferase
MLALLVTARPIPPGQMENEMALQVRVEDGTATIRTRNGHDYTGTFPEIAKAARGFDNCIIDGEICAVGRDGLTDFSALQAAKCMPWLAGLDTPQEDREFYRERVFRDCTVWGASEGAELVAIIAFRDGWIDQFYVLPSAQGQGIGSQLLLVPKSSQRRLQLWTFQRNEAARRFYEARGFVAVRKTNGADNEEREPDILYCWSHES